MNSPHALGPDRRDCKRPWKGIGWNCHRRTPPGELNGFSIKDVNGKDCLLSHLSGVASRLQVKTKVECLVLLTFLKDRDPKIRFIAAKAIENVVQAYPEGMSVSDMTEIDSDGHREMVRRFVEKIDKLAD